MTRTPLDTLAQPVPSELCRRLREQADILQGSHPERVRDAICVFLHLHFCVCTQASASSILPIRELNRRFVDICLSRIQNGCAGQTGEKFLSKKWRRAWVRYKKSPCDYVPILARAIIAHIDDDLVQALLDTWASGIELSKSEFDSMSNHIEACIDREFSRPPLSDDTKTQVLFYVAKHTAAESITIRGMRDSAWERAKMLTQSSK